MIYSIVDHDYYNPKLVNNFQKDKSQIYKYKYQIKTNIEPAILILQDFIWNKFSKGNNQN
jgi:hypothetical protein